MDETSAIGAGGKYMLRTSHWGEVDPSHPFYSAEEANQVGQRLSSWRQRPTENTAHTPKGASSKSKEDGSEAFLPPPWIAAAGLSYLPSLGELLHSDELLSVLR